MRITKIVEKTPIINENGEWMLFCQVYMGNSYVYGAIICKTMGEAFAIKEGQMLDSEEVKFSKRTNNICK